MKNACYTYFLMTGNFEPDEISRLMSLQPERSWRIGDLRHNGTEYDFAHWSFGRCDEYDGMVEEQIRKTIAPLADKIDRLNRIRREYGVKFTLEIVPTVYPGESAPSLVLPMDVIDFCHATRTEIDIDLYVMKAEVE